jgi:putative transposase
MTMAELETWLLHQIAGVYHHPVHQGISMAPITAWTEAVAKSTRPPRVVANENQFYLDFLPFRRRLFQRGGIAMFNISYSDGVISTFLSKPRQKFTVRYDPRDMSKVYLHDREGARLVADAYSRCDMEIGSELMPNVITDYSSTILVGKPVDESLHYRFFTY